MKTAPNPTAFETAPDKANCTRYRQEVVVGGETRKQLLAWLTKGETARFTGVGPLFESLECGGVVAYCAAQAWDSDPDAPLNTLVDFLQEVSRSPKMRAEFKRQYRGRPR